MWRKWSSYAPVHGLNILPSPRDQIIKFASKHNLALLADEVYQLNIMGLNKFVSMRKVLYEYVISLA